MNEDMFRDAYQASSGNAQEVFISSYPLQSCHDARYFDEFKMEDETSMSEKMICLKSSPLVYR